MDTNVRMLLSDIMNCTLFRIALQLTKRFIPSSTEKFNVKGCGFGNGIALRVDFL